MFALTLSWRISSTGECNGMRLINGFAEELSGKQGWKTLGYPLVCEAK